jgi:hypothetical protein
MNKACLAAIWIFVLGCRLNVPPEKELPLDAEVIVDVPAPDARLPACMTDPTYTAAGEHRYKYSSSSVDYDTAIERCAADDAHLAVIDSMAENEQVKLLIGGDTWIGLDDLTVDTDFRWITGATGTFRFFGTAPTIKENEDCVFMKLDGKWDQTGCGSPKRVLCECEPEYLPPPAPVCRQMTGATIREGRWYYARTAPATWLTAETDCRSMGAHLAVIGDLFENGQLDVAFTGSPYWIGYTDAAVEGQFQWVNGSPSTFQRFVGGAPANAAEDCAILFDGGAWGDRPCDAAFPYACECDPLPP